MTLYVMRAFLLKNKSEFTAGMIGEASPSYEVMNPELLICTMDNSAKLEIEITLDASGTKKTPHPLLLQMYSKENEVLFI